MSEASEKTASQLIDEKIGTLNDWRGPVLGRMRQLIREADPDVVEEIKWRKPSNPGGVPTWSHGGIICTGETYNGKVKLTFAKDAKLDTIKGYVDDSGFNGSLNGGTMRAIDIGEGDEIDGEGFKELVKAAIALNVSKGAR